jgi:peptide/nickel transport system substrate-binding protein
MDRRAFLAASAGTLAAPFLAPGKAEAQSASRAETLLLVQEYGPNSMDMQGIGASQPVNGVALNCYDRLLSYKKVPLPDGSGSTFTLHELEPELAESWQEASDGMSVTFKLREARFHSGRPVTAKDVKWSLDRAVSIGGFATTQMNAGSMEKPEQFVAIDGRTFRIDFIRKDKLLMPNLGVTIPYVIDSTTAIANSGGDSWAKEWLKNNVAGSGAFKVESWKPGNETIYVRNEEWWNTKPKLRRIITRDIASPSTRRALLERGDADVSALLPPKDFADLAAAGKVKVVGVPVPNGIWYCAMNSATGPFTDVRLRQAVAWAMPYDKIMQVALFGRGVNMSGARGGPTIAWPQPFPYESNLEKAKALVQQAAPGGITTSVLFDAGQATVAEPIAILLKEALAPLGINVELNKVPGANFRGELAKKNSPMVINRFAGWLDWPDYYFFWNFHGSNSIFNVASYQNAEMDKLIDAARFTGDKAAYEAAVKGFVGMAQDQVPVVPLAQPLHDMAMQKSIGGYQFWPSREPDFRSFTKG